MKPYFPRTLAVSRALSRCRIPQLPHHTEAMGTHRHRRTSSQLATAGGDAAETRYGPIQGRSPCGQVTT